MDKKPSRWPKTELEREIDRIWHVSGYSILVEIVNRSVPSTSFAKMIFNFSHLIYVFL